MARVLLRLRAAETAINEHASEKWVCPSVARGSSGSSSSGCSFGHGNSCSGDSPVSQISPVISDCERRANFHGPQRGGGFFRCFGLFKKMNSSLVAIVSDEIWRFFQTKTAQCAACIHIPLPGHVLGLFAQFIRHDSIERCIN